MEKKYTVVKVIGEGGYGIVYKCIKKSTGETVAIKKYKEKNCQSLRKVLRREIDILKKIKHENIIELKESFFHEEQFYLVFEYANKNLLEILEESSNGLNPEIIKSYIYQMCEAVSYLHKNKIIHRDIKPENFLVNENNKIKLCDFDLARKINSKIENDEKETINNITEPLTDYVATRWYRAPELLLSCGNYGPEIDFWGIGCIMGELADGNPVFPGESIFEQLEIMIKLLGNLPDNLVEMYKNNKNYNIKEMLTVTEPETLEKKYNNFYDEDAIDFLKNILQLDPNKRLNSENVFKHKYLAQIFKEKLKTKLLARKKISASLLPEKLKIANTLLIDTLGNDSSDDSSSNMSIDSDIEEGSNGIVIINNIKNDNNKNINNDNNNINNDNNKNINNGTSLIKNESNIDLTKSNNSLIFKRKDINDDNFEKIKSISYKAIRTIPKSKYRSDLVDFSSNYLRKIINSIQEQQKENEKTEENKNISNNSIKDNNLLINSNDNINNLENNNINTNSNENINNIKDNNILSNSNDKIDNIKDNSIPISCNDNNNSNGNINNNKDNIIFINNNDKINNFKNNNNNLVNSNDNINNIKDNNIFINRNDKINNKDNNILINSNDKINKNKDNSNFIKSNDNIKNNRINKNINYIIPSLGSLKYLKKGTLSEIKLPKFKFQDSSKTINSEVKKITASCNSPLMKHEKRFSNDFVEQHSYKYLNRKLMLIFNKNKNAFDQESKKYLSFPVKIINKLKGNNLFSKINDNNVRYQNQIDLENYYKNNLYLLSENNVINEKDEFVFQSKPKNKKIIKINNDNIKNEPYFLNSYGKNDSIIKNLKREAPIVKLDFGSLSASCPIKKKKYICYLPKIYNNSHRGINLKFEEAYNKKKNKSICYRSPLRNKIKNRILK